MTELSIIIPVYNEVMVLSELYERLTLSAGLVTENYELLFVNDGSTDGSLHTILKLAESDSRVRYISLSRNFGHQIAISAGLDHSRGNAVVIIDGDLQDPPELIPELYKKHKDGYEVVYARRIQRKGESVFKKVTAAFFYRLLKSITAIDIPVDTGDYRLIDKKIAVLLRQMPEQNKFLRGQIAWLGFRQTFITFEREKRRAGKTGYSFSKMLKFAIDGITAFSDVPLKLVTQLGLFVSFIAFVVILYALYAHYFLKQTITGWTSLIVSSMFIGGIQLISIGIIGEYISRINTNVQNRPLYIIDQTNLIRSTGMEEK